MLKYHVDHCWVNLDSKPTVIGISDLARERLGDIIYLDLPQVGDEIARGEQFAEIESTKTTSDVIAPLSGKVVETNEALEDEIGPLNQDPTGQGWLIKLEPSDEAELADLMSLDDYLARNQKED